MRFLLIGAAFLLLTACAERPRVGVTISNTPETIESCGSKVGRC